MRVGSTRLLAQFAARDPVPGLQSMTGALLIASSVSVLMSCGRGGHLLVVGGLRSIGTAFEAAGSGGGRSGEDFSRPRILGERRRGWGS